MILRTLCLLSAMMVLAALFGCSADSSDEGPVLTAVVTSDSVTIELEGQAGVSVFDLLKFEHDVDYTSTAGGVFVTAIDSVTNGNDHYWLYSVNDSMAQVAADKYLTSPGDKVTWHLRTRRE